MRANGFLVYICLAIVALSQHGCGSELARVQGVVTFDGKPLSDARVVFEAPDAPMAVATTDEHGRYDVSTGSQTGMAPGRYNVAVSAYRTRGAAGGLEAPIPVLLTPKHYNSAATSGLTADIHGGRNEDVDFDLSSSDARAK